MRRSLVRLSGASAALLALSATLGAQTSPGTWRAPGTLAMALLSTPAPAPGREARLAPSVARAAAGWTQDALGSVVLRRGSGSPRRVVACALDQPTFVVSEITDDGYLRLHDPAGFPHVSLPLAELEVAWRAERIGYRRGAFRCWLAPSVSAARTSGAADPRRTRRPLWTSCGWTSVRSPAPRSSDWASRLWTPSGGRASRPSGRAAAWCI